MPAARSCLTIVLAFSLAVFPGIALAWGSITHAYLASKALGGCADPLTLYGAAAPDIFENTIALPAYGILSRETHTYPLKMLLWAGPRGLGPFALGFISHNNVRGADFYAHRRGMTTRTGYVIAKALALKGTVQQTLEGALARAGVPFPALVASRFAEDVAHALVETAIDVLVHYRHDPGIAGDLGYGAVTRPGSVPALLVRAFSLSLTRQTGFDEETVSALLLSSENGFRKSITEYVGALAPEESQAVLNLSSMGAAVFNAVAIDRIGQDVGIVPEDLAPLLYAAMDEVEKDYAIELEQVELRLKGYLKIWRMILDR